MPKAKPKPPDITDKIKELHKLIVSRSADKTDKYDKRITELQTDVDLFYYGIKT